MLGALGALFVLGVASCGHTGRLPAVVDGARRVTVLHTNDIHAHYLPERAEYLEGTPNVGGFVRLGQEIEDLRDSRAKASVLLLDGGDQLTGTPLSDLELRGAKGGAMHDFFEALDYDAWALGNHEFDKGLDNLKAYTAGTDIPVLSSNVLGLDGAPLLPNQEKSHVFERNGVRIGVVGVTTGRLQGLMTKADFARLQLLPEAVAVQAEVNRLDPLTDVIVVLSHIGVDEDQRLANEVKGIDLIVGGHSHTRLTRPIHVGDTWIVQAASYNRALGVVDFGVVDDHITDLKYELHDLWPGTAKSAPDPKVVAFADRYKSELDRVYGEVVATAKDTLGRSYNHENALGRWITDALRAETGADVAFYNGGGLRADLVAGPVTRGALFECFPFNNEVHLFKILGKDLLGVVIANLHAEHEESRGYLSTSGLTWTWRVREGAVEVVEAKVGGQPLDPSHLYTAVASSYVTEHWEKHLMVEPVDLAGTGRTDFEVAVEYAKHHAVEDPKDRRGVKLD